MQYLLITFYCIFAFFLRIIATNRIIDSTKNYPKNKSNNILLFNYSKYYEAILMRIGNNSNKIFADSVFVNYIQKKNCPEIPSSFSYKALITFMFPLRFLNFQSFVDLFFSHLWIFIVTICFLII